ncbi:Mu transposase C-terminal domain-containing protein [Nocardiopsis dassonvillei]|uniref:Mu transposase C-terminal domain-containing protein n=1 Tax=Nocardiopsis dassonvillei TaxID=2014 RepID=UPI00200FE71C|nr:Mu transposase C-terminal domain-containing protein [Nocardiopsis dassonvillei]MCK9871405.1 Mu transposase C-terminal domain-containing protein [Nocardiopsis dassonvillei]
MAGRVLRPGDRILFDDAEWTVTAVGEGVRLVDGVGSSQVVLLSYLLSSAGFELLSSVPAPVAPRLEPAGLLETLPAAVVEKARAWERHVLEVQTGLLPGAQQLRAGFDPQSTRLEQREAAKAAELTAAGKRTSAVTVKRRRLRYRAQGLWGLVDHRHTRPSSPYGRVDERVVQTTRDAIAAQAGQSTGTKSRLRRQVQEAVIARFGEGTVPLPSARTFDRLVDALSTGQHTFGTATTRRSLTQRPEGAFTRTVAHRPGELVQIDTTPLDVMAVFDDGVTGRVELTIALDMATRTICAAIVRPRATKAVDASLLLARMLVPEPMRPGWSQALSMAHSRIPHPRLLELDARLKQAAARPVIAPEAVVIDRGRVFISETFVRACERLGISMLLARPRTPTDKAIVERTFGSINTLFCQHVAGYTGSSTTHRGQDVQARTVWTVEQVQELFDEWVLAGWQVRPHEGLRDPHLPATVLSPNEMYAALITAAGYVPIPLVGEDYLELLPVQWRRINADGIHLDHRTYDCSDLNPLRRQESGITAKGGRWAVHYDPYDLSRVWVRDTRTGGWITVPWSLHHLARQPFADFTWRAARQVVAQRGGDDTDQAAVAAALERLLTRAGEGPAHQRRTAARTRSAPSHLPRTTAPAPPEPAPDEEQELAQIIPFGVFDPTAEEPYR